MKPFFSLSQTRPFSALLLLVTFFASIILTGCADGVFSVEDPAETYRRTDGDKFRQAHMIERAYRAAPGKSASSQTLGLIVSAQSGVDKQRMIERFRAIERFRMIERFDYDNALYGFAWTIEDLEGSSDYQEFLDALANDPDVLWFEPDFDMTSPDANPTSSGSGQEVPWSVAAVGGQTSWAVSGDGQGDVNVQVYVLDTGVAKADNGDPNDDLALVENIDYREGMDDAKDYDGHGTHVAGIIGAVDDNDGLVGLAPGARIHNLKVLDDNGSGDVSQVIAAIEYITSQKLANPSTPMVANLSLGEDVGNNVFSALDEAVSASVAAGVVYVVAAGNQGTTASNVTPAKVDAAITVGSYAFNGSFSDFSNYGPKVDILAPGEGILSMSPAGSGNNVTMTGTSMAAAHVTGAVALYLGQNPSATPAQVEAALLADAKDFVTNAPSSTTSKSVWVGQEGGTATIFEKRVSDDDDDAEEDVEDGDMYLDSSDLELVKDGGDQLIGMRFTGVSIPQGAAITNAYIQFTVDETNSGTTNLTIHGQDANDAASFSDDDDDISDRPTTSASVVWSPPAWNSVGAAGADQRTPDLSSIIQEIVDRGGWSSGNDMVLIVSGTGERTAESHDGDEDKAPLLHIEWEE